MNKAALVISLVCLCCVLAGGFFLMQGGVPAGMRPGAGRSWTPDDQRELAGRLKGAGLTRQSIHEYEQYAQTATLDRPTLANLSYTIGKMYMDAGDYEKALAWLYRVEIADPQTKLKTEVGSGIVTCLERAGKYSAAEYALSRRTSGAAQPGRTQGTVIAEISGEKVYLEDVTEAIDRMPEWMRTQLAGKQAKLEFAKKYIADELFYRKAVKLAYDKDPELLSKMKDVEKELVVNKVIETELKDKIKVEDDDVRNYFDAHRRDYEQKEAVRVSLIKAGMKEIAEKIVKDVKAGKDFNKLAQEISLDKNTAGNGGRFSGWVRKGENDLGIGSVAEVSAALFGRKTGEITQPVAAGDAWYVFRIEETRPAQLPDFDEVKDRVKNDYSMQKLKVLYQGMLDQTLKSSDVKLYLEKISGDEKK